MAKIWDFILTIVIIGFVLAILPALISCLGAVIVWVLQAIVVVFAISLVVGLVATLFEAIFGSNASNEKTWAF